MFCVYVSWTKVLQDQVQWQALIYEVLSFQYVLKEG
jgi:hypothetical protein